MKAARSLRGEITPPPDKSITHRAIIFAGIAKGKSIIRNPLMAADPLSTMNAMKMLGVEIVDDGASSSLVVNGGGLHSLSEPVNVIDCGNSGTTARLLSGILAGNPFFSVLTGDDSLRKRPMRRIIKPLKEMGTWITGRDGDSYLPLAIKGGFLKPIKYTMPVASAQVKSCIILAGLYADGITTVIEPGKSRDHTERMLRAMGAVIDAQNGQEVIRIHGMANRELNPVDIVIPSDFSSAAFFIVGALITPHSEILIRNTCVNPTRTGLLEVIKMMGGEVKLENHRIISGEPVADIYVRTAERLKGVKIPKSLIPSMIDEFPVLCILATQAEGITEIHGADELRVKESDRIKAMATELRMMGVEVEEFPDGMAIKGRVTLKGCVVESYMDHRIAMSFAVASLISDGETVINNPECVEISFPTFFDHLDRLKR